VVVGVEKAALTGSDYWEWLSDGTPVAVKTVGRGGSYNRRLSLNRLPDGHTTVKLSNACEVKQNRAGENVSLHQSSRFS